MKCSFCNTLFVTEKGVKLHLRLCLCKKVQYCDKECQKRHHDEHKLVCSYFNDTLGGEANSEDEFEEQPFRIRHKPLALSARKGFSNPPSAGHKSQPSAGHKNQPRAGHKNQPSAGHKNQPSAGHKNQPSVSTAGLHNQKIPLKQKQINNPAFKNPHKGHVMHLASSPPDHSPPTSHVDPPPPKSKKPKPPANPLNNAERDAKTGKFTSKSANQTDQQRKSAIVAANGRDFRHAKQRLKSIIARNKEGGENWEFKIESQKKYKGAKHQHHCWTSSKYRSMAVHEKNLNSPSSKEEDLEESYPVQSSKRVCTNCKHPIVGPQWSYIVCRGDGCRNGMSHFSCLGFPDVSKALIILMKQEYECPGCNTNRVAALDQDADFQPQPKKKKKGHNPKLSQMLREKLDKNKHVGKVGSAGVAGRASQNTDIAVIEDSESDSESDVGNEEIVYTEQDIMI